MFLTARKKHLLAVPANPESHQQRDRGDALVQADLDPGAVQDQSHDILLRQIPGLPGRPVAPHLAPGPAHGILRHRAAEQAGQGPAHPPGVGAGKINLGDERLGPLGHALVGADRLAVPFLLTAALVDQPGARQRNPLLTEGPDKLPIPVAVAIALGRTLALVALAPAERGQQFRLHHRLDKSANLKTNRLFQRIEPSFTGIWNRRRRCFKMFHGVSSFRRL